jgi:hypothetical protein
MDRMDGRLANIEQLLSKFLNVEASGAGSLPTPQTSISQLTDELTMNRALDVSSDETSAPGVGFVAESLNASRAIDQKVNSPGSFGQDEHLSSSLKSLHRLITLTRDDSESFQPPTRHGRSGAYVGVPGWEQVQPILSRYMGKLTPDTIQDVVADTKLATKPSKFNWVSSGVQQDFCRKCRVMYAQGSEESPTYVYHTESRRLSDVQLPETSF